MYIELMTIIFLILLFWFFNLRENQFIIVKIPIEAMSNVSIFDGNKI
jgi:hypothetical protein